MKKIGMILGLLVLNTASWAGPVGAVKLIGLYRDQAMMESKVDMRAHLEAYRASMQEFQFTLTHLEQLENADFSKYLLGQPKITHIFIRDWLDPSVESLIKFLMNNRSLLKKFDISFANEDILGMGTQSDQHRAFHQDLHHFLKSKKIGFKGSYQGSPDTATFRFSADLLDRQKPMPTLRDYLEEASKEFLAPAPVPSPGAVGQ